MLKMLLIPVGYLMFNIIHKHWNYKQIRNFVIIGSIIAIYFFLKKTKKDNVVERMLSLSNDTKVTPIKKDIEEIKKVTDYLKNNAKLIGRINFTNGQKFATLTKFGETIGKNQYSNNFFIYEKQMIKKVILFMIKIRKTFHLQI